MLKMVRCVCVLFFVFAWALCNDGAMVGRHWCYFLHVFFFLVAFLHSPFFSFGVPCRFSCDFICLRTSAYIVVVAQFFLVFLYLFFFCLFSCPQILCKCRVTTSFLPLLLYACVCVRFFFSLFEAMHGESHRIKIPAIVFSLHVWATEIVSFKKFKR